MNKKHYLLILIIVSLVVHFAFFGHPAETVFDEVHFGKFVSGYYTHEYFFDIHPPLGKMMIAGFAKLFGFKPEFSFAKIGDKFPDKQYLALRFLPTFAGVLLPVIIFLLLLKLQVRPFYSFFGGLLLALDNGLLTQSRYILMDSFLLLFGFSSLLFYLHYLKSSLLRTTRYLLLTGLAGALAISIKWTGASFLGLIGIIEIVRIIKSKEYKNFGRFVVYLIVIPIAVYFAIFAIHFSLLYKSGTGDAFMSPEFQRTLEGNSNKETPGKTLNSVGKFINLNLEMYRSNQRLTASHPYSSPWYTWPFMQRTVYYWVGSASSPQMDSASSPQMGSASSPQMGSASSQPSQNASAGTAGQAHSTKPQGGESVESTGSPQVSSRIYFIGNPLTWWGSAVTMLLALLWNLKLKIFNLKTENILFIGFVGYFINLLPFIGVKRVMFLYHYMPALIFAILIMAYLADKYGLKKLSIAIMILSVISFVYFAPLNYGLKLTPSQYEARNWLSTWR